MLRIRCPYETAYPTCPARCCPRVAHNPARARAPVHAIRAYAPATVLAAELAADPAPPQFLRDLPDLQELISAGDGWTIGGGYLYWSQCPAVDSGGGYLRRWPLHGGRAVTLVSGRFCTNTTTWAAAESGLYYGDGANLLRRPASNPLAAEWAKHQQCRSAALRHAQQRHADVRLAATTS